MARPTRTPSRIAATNRACQLPTLGLYRIQLLPGRSLLSAEATRLRWPELCDRHIHCHAASRATAETRSTVAPLRRGARVGLTLSCDIIIRPVAETAGILRSPSTMLHPYLGKSSAPSQAEVGFRRVTKGAGALRLLKPVRHGRRPSTKHRSSCCIGLLRCATFTTVAAHS